MSDEFVSVRYIVDDVDAMLSRGALQLALNAPGGGGGAGQAMPDGTSPEPGGWNRFMVEVAGLATTVEQLRAAGARFRNDIVNGRGGRQILLEDPAGNPIELFEPADEGAASQASRR